MKIGIITVCDNTINYGSFWQMYTLQIALFRLGVNRKDIYTIKPIVKERNITKSFKQYNEMYILKKGIPYRIWKCLRCAQKLCNLVQRQNRYYKLCKNLGIQFINIKKAQKLCDVIIVGSDAVWNIDSSGMGTPFYFAKGFEKKKILGYAISAGEAVKMQFVEKEYPIQGISSFERVSVRDLRTKQILNELNFTSIDLVPDPTVLVPISEIVEQYDFEIGKPFLLVYTWGCKEWEKERIKRFCRENGLISVCAMGQSNNSWVDIEISPDPIQFIDIMKKADYVYASTFHGCIFSILCHKKGAFFSSVPKVNDLLERYNLSEKICNEETAYECFSQKMKEEININMLEEKINEERKKGLDWLKMNLNF